MACVGIKDNAKKNAQLIFTDPSLATFTFLLAVTHFFIGNRSLVCARETRE